MLRDRVIKAALEQRTVESRLEVVVETGTLGHSTFLCGCPVPDYSVLSGHRTHQRTTLLVAQKYCIKVSRKKAI